MKKILLLLSFLSPFVGLTQKSPTTENKRLNNSIALEPLAFLGSGMQLSYDRDFGVYNGLKLIAGYYAKDEPLAYDAQSMNGFNGQLIYKRYLDPYNSGDLRFYFGLIGLYKQIFLDDFSDDGYWEELDELGNPITIHSELKRDINVGAFGGGLLIGSSVKFENQFYTDISLGGVILVSNGDKNDARDAHIPLVNPYKSGIVPRFNIGIGYAF
jgi:hypothetical protein